MLDHGVCNFCKRLQLRLANGRSEFFRYQTFATFAATEFSHSVYLLIFTEQFSRVGAIIMVTTDKTSNLFWNHVMAGTGFIQLI